VIGLPLAFGCFHDILIESDFISSGLMPLTADGTEANVKHSATGLKLLEPLAFVD
jgi:hypothetical protein